MTNVGLTNFNSQFNTISWDSVFSLNKDPSQYFYELHQDTEADTVVFKTPQNSYNMFVQDLERSSVKIRAVSPCGYGAFSQDMTVVNTNELENCALPSSPRLFVAQQTLNSATL